GGGRTIDDAMVIGERQRQHQPGDERGTVPNRPGRRAAYAENGYLGSIDDRGEGGSADPTERGDGESSALHVARRELSCASLLRQFGQLARDLEQPFAIGLLYHWHDQTAGGIRRESD